MNSSRRISPGCTGFSFLAILASSVVVRDFNVVGIALLPGKTNPPLIVDPNTSIALAVPARPVPGGCRGALRESADRWRHRAYRELPKSGALDGAELPAGLAMKEPSPQSRPDRKDLITSPAYKRICVKCQPVQKGIFARQALASLDHLRAWPLEWMIQSFREEVRRGAYA